MALNNFKYSHLKGLTIECQMHLQVQDFIAEFTAWVDYEK